MQHSHRGRASPPPIAVFTSLTSCGNGANHGCRWLAEIERGLEELEVVSQRGRGVGTGLELVAAGRWRVPERMTGGPLWLVPAPPPPTFPFSNSSRLLARSHQRLLLTSSSEPSLVAHPHKTGEVHLKKVRLDARPTRSHRIPPQPRPHNGRGDSRPRLKRRLYPTGPTFSCRNQEREGSEPMRVKPEAYSTSHPGEVASCSSL